MLFVVVNFGMRAWLMYHLVCSNVSVPAAWLETLRISVLTYIHLSMSKIPRAYPTMSKSDILVSQPRDRFTMPRCLHLSHSAPRGLHHKYLNQPCSRQLSAISASTLLSKFIGCNILRSSRLAVAAHNGLLQYQSEAHQLCR